MSAHTPCTCEGTRKERMKNWRVTQRNFNCSYFVAPKGLPKYSDYSSVICLNCNMGIRSKAKFVDSIPSFKTAAPTQPDAPCNDFVEKDHGVCENCGFMHE